MCSLFGILDYKQNLDSKIITTILSVLSRECEVRGTDATGIAYLRNGNINIFKRPLPAHRIRLKIPRDCHVVMGHTRLTTQGNERYNPNNHPFEGIARNTSFALAHNGVLRNDRQLRITEQLSSTKIKTDSYVAVQLIEKQKALTFSSLRYMAEKVEGSFTFTVLDECGNLYFVKGDSPMCIYNFNTLGFYVYASTEDILKNAISKIGLAKYAHEEVVVSEGCILMLGADGKEQREHFDYDNVWNLWRYWHRHKTSRSLPTPDTGNTDYWEELRYIASSYGYSSDDVDIYCRLGYSPDEVEEIFNNGLRTTDLYDSGCEGYRSIFEYH